MRQQSSEETDVGQVTMNLGRIIMLEHTEKSLHICFCTCTSITAPFFSPDEFAACGRYSSICPTNHGVKSCAPEASVSGNIRFAGNNGNQTKVLPDYEILKERFFCKLLRKVGKQFLKNTFFRIGGRKVFTCAVRITLFGKT